MMRRRAGILALLVTVSFGAVAHAQVDLKTAKEHYFKAERFFKIERFGDAFTEYQEAYLSRPDPNFLFNMAQCRRLMGNREDALRFYRRFLIARPNPPNLAVVERHIRELEEMQPPPLVVLPPPSPAPSPVAPPPPVLRKAAILGGASKPSVQVNTPPPTPAPAPVAAVVPALAYDSPRAGVSSGDAGGLRSTTAPQGASATAPPPALPPALPASSLAMAHDARDVRDSGGSQHLLRNVAADADQPDAGRPIYKKWWFWTALGAAAVGVLVIGVTAGHKSDPSCDGLVACR